MPKYLDHHALPGPLPPEMTQQMVALIKAGRPDQFGVKPLNDFIGKDRVWCLTEAPNADAVHKTHEAMGIPLGPGDVYEVTSLV